MLKRPSTLAVMLLLAACATRVPRVLPPAPLRVLESMPLAGLYQIDPLHSELRVLVYRAGPLSNFGHNHVVVNRALSGSVRVGPSIQTSEFMLSIPVAQFIVDDPGTRREEGDEFSGEVSASTREGTLHNMLSAALLNAENSPDIEIRGEQLQEIEGSLNATLVLRIAGHEAKIATPFAVEQQAGGIAATAIFEVRQSELGLTPMSLLGGALQVRDAMEVKLTLTALRGAAN